MMDWLVRTPIPFFTQTQTLHATKALRPLKVAIKPPPSDFDFRTEISQLSRARIAGKFPQLLDLADSGALLLIEKSQFGPVPAWRSEFVEPEMIWLVGTSHISPKSAADVERVVRTVQPDNVVVELCRSRQGIAESFRAGIMYASSENGGEQQLRSGMFSLSGSGFLGAIGRSINLGGQTALALRLLLAAFSSKISNRPFGDEFRAARRISEEVGAQIVLGDRPIEITLERAWNCLKWDQRISLVNSVLRGIASQTNLKDMNTEEEEEEEDSAFALYEQLSFSYPSLLDPLIHERDTYLAWSLKRSKAVNNSKRVVGVIGKGHINGVVYSLISDQGNLRFKDLVGGKRGDGSNRFIQNLVKSLIRDTLIGIVLWAAYEFVKAAGGGGGGGGGGGL